jgi:hypothetical protein
VAAKLAPHRSRSRGTTAISFIPPDWAMRREQRSVNRLSYGKGLPPSSRKMRLPDAVMPYNSTKGESQYGKGYGSQKGNQEAEEEESLGRRRSWFFGKKAGRARPFSCRLFSLAALLSELGPGAEDRQKRAGREPESHPEFVFAAEYVAADEIAAKHHTEHRQSV